MISIIICSRIPEINPALFQNIDETIGYEYELIVIDNSKNIYSIFEAYNIGIKKSKGDYWCFMHDDIVLHSTNWGKQIVRMFQTNSAIGLIGVAGTRIKTKMPSAWWHCPENQKVINIIQHFNTNDLKKLEIGFDENLWEEVSLIDGVFMVGRRDEVVAFNEKLTGFHNYDLNLSLAYRMANYKIVVTKTILLEHFSSGTRDKTWCLSTLQFDSIYANFLPHQIGKPISRCEWKMLEFYNGSVFCENLIKYNLKVEAFKYWCKLLLIKPIAKFHLHFIKLLIS